MTGSTLLPFQGLKNQGHPPVGGGLGLEATTSHGGYQETGQTGGQWAGLYGDGPGSLKTTGSFLPLAGVRAGPGACGRLCCPSQRLPLGRSEAIWPRPLFYRS